MNRSKIKILDLYIIKKFLGSFAGVIALVILIVVAVDAAENIQDFLDSKAPAWDIFLGYYCNFIPYFVNLLSPIFVFIAVIYFTSKLSRHSEIVAMLNTGMSFYRLMIPYIISAIVIGILSFYLANFLIPQTNRGLMEFKERYGSRQIKTRNVDCHIKISANGYVYVKYWEHSSGKGYDFSYEKLEKDGVKYKLYASTIERDTVENQWILNNYVKHVYNGINETMETGVKMNSALGFDVSDFVIIRQGHSMMSYSEIRKFIKEEKAKGVEAKDYEYEKHRRIAFPFATIILSVIGLCVSSRKSRQGVGLHLLLGLLITFSFVMLMQFAQVFATFGNFPPLWAAWTPNIIYSFLCIFLIIKTPK
ncbi:MAG: LptF/LptG family permease [Lentimicrobiaceae bacterium]|nr:LptF/LptG family permease [Lentimicrobiaceae bacterium]